MRVELPPGYVEYDRGSVCIVAARLELEEMVSLLSGPQREPGGGWDDRCRQGRGGTRKIVLPGGKAVYLRKYLRGGLVRHLSGDLYLLRPPRPLRELIVTETARAAGCPVPAVAAVCIEEAGLFYRGWIVTAAIEGTRSFFASFKEAGPRDRERLLLAAGRAIRTIHNAGVYHVDLTGHNLLVAADGSVSLIDFDRAFLARPNVIRLAEKGRDRFWRSMNKLAGQAGLEIAAAERRWLERGYAR